MRVRLAAAMLAFLAVVLVPAAPAAAHAVGGVGATNFRTALSGLTPSVPGISPARDRERLPAGAHELHRHRGGRGRLLRRAVRPDRPGRRLRQRQLAGDLPQRRPVLHRPGPGRRQRGRPAPLAPGLRRPGVRLARPPGALDAHDPAAAGRRVARRRAPDQLVDRRPLVRRAAADRHRHARLGARPVAVALARCWLAAVAAGSPRCVTGPARSGAGRGAVAMVAFDVAARPGRHARHHRHGAGAAGRAVRRGRAARSGRSACWRRPAVARGAPGPLWLAAVSARSSRSPSRRRRARPAGAPRPRRGGRSTSTGPWSPSSSAGPGPGAVAAAAGRGPATHWYSWDRLRRRAPNAPRPCGHCPMDASAAAVPASAVDGLAMRRWRCRPSGPAAVPASGRAPAGLAGRGRGRAATGDRAARGRALGALAGAAAGSAAAGRAAGRPLRRRALTDVGARTVPFYGDAAGRHRDAGTAAGTRCAGRL